ncbi:MAG TPA: nucleoside triphosphate pyrophosphohydrolase [Chthoniobacterales bacterium]|nr:nucleoside triphosphate pyrophosphohydrolase [Chthoniobacterales bacterium]
MVSPIDRLKQIVERLRSPDGCPWDREQTHASLKPHIIEECYELIEAIDDQDDQGMREELGDVLLQVVLHAQMAGEEGRFDFDSVAEVISEKLIRRHPHVFGDTKLATSDAVLKQWDAIKRGEKTDRESALDGVPRGLPGLAKAQKLQSKATRVGFDWPDAVGPLEKVKEEISEIEQAGTGEKLAEELGDLLFSVVNFARKNQLDAEELVQAANRKFSDRFRKMEALAVSRGLNFSCLTLSEMDQLWNEVKQSGSSSSAV